MFSYQPLWITLARKNMQKTELLKKPGISSATLAKLGKNEYVSLNVLDNICESLQCSIEDIVQHIPNANKNLE
ncbi:MAG: helix-turn-helix domain-containing protein [Clostridia bacterium]